MTRSPNRRIEPSVPLRLLLSALFGLVFFCGAVRGESGGEALVSRLKTEGAAALRARQNRTGDIHLKWFLSAKNNSCQYELYSQGTNSLVRAERVPGGQDEGFHPQSYRYVKTGFHSFKLSRETETGPWKIETYDRFRDKADRDDEALRLIRESSPYYIGVRPLAEFLEDERLKITRIESKTDRGEETIAAHFEIPLNGIFEPDAPGTAFGSVSLLPAKGWGIAELSLRFTKENIPRLLEKKFTFDNEADSPFPVRSMETKTTLRPESEASETLDEEHIRYLVCDDARPAQKEFSLKYYGLRRPDHRTPAEKRFSRTLMALGGAILLFGLARKYKMLRRRKGTKKRIRRGMRRRKETFSSDQ
ncbi:MAG: hypothetical protein J6S40_07780 [Thermoguttaceae bacterium]|nr:hypothetical protein [Thermoguttaceae bacterium]